MEAPTARIHEAQGRVSDIEDKMIESKETEEKREKQLLEHEGRFQDISDTINKTILE